MVVVVALVVVVVVVLGGCGDVSELSATGKRGVQK